MAPDTHAMLDRIGPMHGWSCIDIGCGPRGITDILSERLGPSGRVVGLDMDQQFIDYARRGSPANVEFRIGDAYNSDLPANSFDLVHMRFVASTAGDPARLIKEATRLARSGGIVALQEPDGSTLNCYPLHPAWDRLKTVLLGVFKGVGADLELARRLYNEVHKSGLSDVQYRTALLGVRSIDPMVDYLPSTVESLRSSILKLGLINKVELDDALDQCRKHLAKAGTAFTLYSVAQVWGRKT
jgi:ubiquinone/menaquinone biosynthesis C-methylase UbiE